MKRLSLAIIHLYQKTFSPDHGVVSLLFSHGACKFYPTCSQYMERAISEYGIVGGIQFGIRRIFRCHPWSMGGIDNVPTIKH